MKVGLTSLPEPSNIFLGLFFFQNVSWDGARVTHWHGGEGEPFLSSRHPSGIRAQVVTGHPDQSPYELTPSHVHHLLTCVDLPRAILGFPRRQTYRLREMCRSRIDSRAQKSTYIKVFRCPQIAGRYMPRKGAKLQLCCTLGGGLFPPCSGVTWRGRAGRGRLQWRRGDGTMEGVVFESIKEEDARTWGSACTQLALTGACNPRLYGIPDGDPRAVTARS